MQWALWAAGTLVSFLVLEVAAIRSRRKTLSSTTRAFFGIKPPRPWRRWGTGAFLAVLYGFAIWFGFHILN